MGFVLARDLRAAMMVLPIAVTTTAVIMVTCAAVVLAGVAIVVLTIIVRCALVVGPFIGVVGMGLCMMSRPSVVLGLMVVVPTVVVSIIVMGSTMVTHLTVVVGLFMVVRLREHTMVGNLTMVVRPTGMGGPPRVVGLIEILGPRTMIIRLTMVVGPIVMSPATRMAIII